MACLSLELFFRSLVCMQNSLVFNQPQLAVGNTGKNKNSRLPFHWQVFPSPSLLKCGDAATARSLRLPHVLTCLPALQSTWQAPPCPLLCSRKIIKGNMIVFFHSDSLCECVCVCLSAWKALSYRYFYNLQQLQLSAQRQAVTSWFMCTVYVYAGGKRGVQREMGRGAWWGRRWRWALVRNPFPGGRKEVVSIKNTNNEIALTVIPFSLTRICWGKKIK